MQEGKTEIYDKMFILSLVGIISVCRRLHTSPSWSTEADEQHEGKLHEHLVTDFFLCISERIMVDMKP